MVPFIMPISSHPGIPPEAKTVLVESDFPTTIRLGAIRRKGYVGIGTWSLEEPEDVETVFESISDEVDNLRTDREITCSLTRGDHAFKDRTVSFRWKLSAALEEHESALPVTQEPRAPSPDITIGSGNERFIQLAFAAVQASERRAWEESDRANSRLSVERNFALELTNRIPALVERMLGVAIEAISNREDHLGSVMTDKIDIAKIDAAKEILTGVGPDIIGLFNNQKNLSAKKSNNKNIADVTSSRESKDTDFQPKLSSPPDTKSTPSNEAIFGYIKTLPLSDRNRLFLWYKNNGSSENIQSKLNEDINRGDLVLSEESKDLLSDLSFFASLPDSDAVIKFMSMHTKKTKAEKLRHLLDPEVPISEKTRYLLVSHYGSGSGSGS